MGAGFSSGGGGFLTLGVTLGGSGLATGTTRAGLDTTMAAGLGGRYLAGRPEEAVPMLCSVVTVQPTMMKRPAHDRAFPRRCSLVLLAMTRVKIMPGMMMQMRVPMVEPVRPSTTSMSGTSTAVASVVPTSRTVSARNWLSGM
uniref:Putative secreted protein n=1 Tax=Ixodes ricinus TaxID=34613 RepID=A0A6B0UUF6_IXORI